MKTTTSPSTTDTALRYTKEPLLSPNIILSSLQIFAWILFRPSAWCNLVNRIDPSLPPDFNLARLSKAQWRNPSLQRMLRRFYVTWILLECLLLGIILLIAGFPRETIITSMLIVVIVCLGGLFTAGVAVSLVVGLISGIFGSVAGVNLSLPIDSITASLSTLTLLAVVGGFIGRTTSAIETRELTNPFPKQVGSIMFGILVSIIVFFLVISIPAWLAVSLVIGVGVGVALWQRHGNKVGLLGGIFVGIGFGGLIIGTVGIAPTVAEVAIRIGISPRDSFERLALTVILMSFFALCYILADNIAGPWAGAISGVGGSGGAYIALFITMNDYPEWSFWFVNIVCIFITLILIFFLSYVLYPFQMAWNTILYYAERQRPNRSHSLLSWNAAFWDETQSLPLHGTENHLLLVLERFPQEGFAALDFLRESRQAWVAQVVQAELDACALESCANIEALQQVHHQLVTGDLNHPTSVILNQFSRISHNIEVALSYSNLYQKRLHLAKIVTNLDQLQLDMKRSNDSYTPRFYPILQHWRQVVDSHLQQLLHKLELSQEIDNPYIVAVPILEAHEVFVARTRIALQIEQLLLDRRRPPLLLYGQRRMGKTSLMRNLGQLLPSTIIPLFVDGEQIAGASDYANLLYSLSHEMRLVATRQRQLTLPPLTLESLHASPFTRFNEWLDTVESLMSQQNTTALLALDELEALDDVLNKGRFDETDILRLLRHLIQHRVSFKVLLSSSHSLDELHRWAGYLVNVQVVHIGYLDQDEAIQLIEQPVDQFQLRYNPSALQRVLDLTRCHPSLVQLLCYHIVELKNEQPPEKRRTVTLTDVEAAIPQALAKGHMVFATIQNQIDERGKTLLRFLAKQGEGTIVSSDVLRQIACSDLEACLLLPLRRDLIEAKNGGYRFQVELIRKWFACL